MRNFTQDIVDVRRRDVSVLRKIEIDLSVAITDQAYNISGNVFYIWDMPDDVSTIEIKVNSNDEHAFSYVKQTGQITPFDTLYITTPAGQAGTCTLAYGTEAPQLVSLIDNRSATVDAVSAVRDELRGDVTPEGYEELTVGAAAVEVLAANADRRACWVHADVDNTHPIYLGFDDNVTTAAGGAKWFAVLEPGAGWGVDDYRGDIYAIAAAQGQLLGVGEW